MEEKSITIIITENDGKVYMDMKSNSFNPLALVGALEILKQRIINEGGNTTESWN